MQVVEIRLCEVEGFRYVFHACEHFILAGEDEQIVKLSELLYRLIFSYDLFFCEYGACHWVLYVETAIDTRVGARVCNINRYKHIDGLAEAFACDALAKTCHRFDIFLGGRRDKCHEVVDGETLFA